MRIALESVEVSDEQLSLIADYIDGKNTKRRATRNQARDFIWSKGQTWKDHLQPDDYSDILGGNDDNEDTEDINLEDLL